MSHLEFWFELTSFPSSYLWILNSYISTVISENFSIAILNCNSSTWELKAGGSRIGHPWVSSSSPCGAKWDIVSNKNKEFFYYLPYIIVLSPRIRMWGYMLIFSVYCINHSSICLFVCLSTFIYGHTYIPLVSEVFSPFPPADFWCFAV